MLNLATTIKRTHGDVFACLNLDNFDKFKYFKTS